jgi:hypothetical protein
MKEFLWTTKEGKEMSVSEMDDNHLLNSISFLKRKIPKGAIEIISTPETDSMVSEVGELNRRELLTDFGYYKLLAEKRRRKLI